LTKGKEAVGKANGNNERAIREDSPSAAEAARECEIRKSGGVKCRDTYYGEQM
jgi:hypothetical protein